MARGMGVDVTDDSATIGQQLRHARQQAGISLGEMARRAGRSAAFLSLVERGKRPWPADLIQLYGLELGVSVESGPRTDPIERSRVADETVDIDVVLSRSGGCDYIRHRYVLRARKNGLHHLNVMVGSVEEVRLSSFEVLQGGELTFDRQGQDQIVRVRFKPLPAGQVHEIVVREDPPGDVGTMTVLVEQNPRIRRLSFTVHVPGDAAVDYALWRINGLEPQYDWIPRDVCEPLPLRNGRATAEFTDLQIGLSYGVLWDW